MTSGPRCESPWQEPGSSRAGPAGETWVLLPPPLGLDLDDQPRLSSAHLTALRGAGCPLPAFSCHQQDVTRCSRCSSSWDTNPWLRAHGGETHHPSPLIHPPLSWRTSPAELQVWGLARPPRPLAPLGCPSHARNPLPVGRSSPWQPSGLVWVCAHGSGLCWGAVWGTQGSAPTPVWLRELFAHLPYRHQGPRKGSEGCGQRWVQGLSRGLPLPQHPPQAPDWNKELQKPLSAPGSTRRAGGVSAWGCHRGWRT